MSIIQHKQKKQALKYDEQFAWIFTCVPEAELNLRQRIATYTLEQRSREETIGFIKDLINVHILNSIACRGRDVTAPLFEWQKNIIKLLDESVAAQG